MNAIVKEIAVKTNKRGRPAINVELTDGTVMAKKDYLAAVKAEAKAAKAQKAQPVTA